MRREERDLGLAAFAFFLSGAASLADEVVWLKYLTLVFGATTAATATLLAVFMGGLALGSAICGRFVSRVRRPDLLYALLESGVAVLALATPLLFTAIESAYVVAFRRLGDGPGVLMPVRVLLSAAALLPPTMLMGATFPAMARAVEGVGRPGRRSTLLYGVNTAGAVAGVALCGLLFIRTVGLHSTLAGSACVSLFAALLVATLRFSPPYAVAAQIPPPAEKRRPGRLWLAIALLTGACAMADEVLWTRVLVLYLGSSVYAFALMLAIFLTGLVGGSLLGAALAPPDPRRALGTTQLALAGSLLLQVFAFPAYNTILVFTATHVLHVSTYSGLLLAEGLTTSLYLLPPTLLMGLSFALLLQAASRSAGTAPADVAAIYSLNTLGGIGGSLLAGFAAIPLIGSQNSLLLTGLLGTGMALFLWPGNRAMRLAPAAYLILALFPRRNGVILSAGVLSNVPRQDLLFFREDVTATVAVKRYAASSPALSLELNGVNVAGTSPDLIVTQELQAHLPLAMTESPRRVLHIGLGSGGTAYSVSRHPVTEIRIVEISPEVAQAADRFFRGVNHGVLADPRVHLTINDGRNFVLATPDSFDAILSDSIHPRYAGNGSLYTEDYFRLCAKRLKPGGVISMWLPMYSLLTENYKSIVRAFQDAFPNVSIWYPHSVPNAFTIVLATPEKTVRLGDLARRVAAPEIAGDLARIGASDPAELLSYLVLAPDDVRRWVSETPPHTDDLPAVEYESGRTLASTGTWARTFTELTARRSRIEDFVSGLSPENPLARRVLQRYRDTAPILARQVADVQARARLEP
jgi:spermidine synthase